MCVSGVASGKLVMLMTVYTASGLVEGTHTIHLTNIAGAQSALDIDYAVVNSTQPGTESREGATSAIVALYTTATQASSSIASSAAAGTAASASANPQTSKTSTGSYGTTMASATTSGPYLPSSGPMTVPTGSSTVQSKSDKEPFSGVNTPAAIGGAIAAVLGIIIVLLAALWIRRRIEQRRREAGLIDEGKSEYPARTEYTIERESAIQALDRWNRSKRGGGLIFGGLGGYNPRPPPTSTVFSTSSYSTARW